MFRRTVRVCVYVAAVLVWPTIASAQWYAAPYVGTAFNVEHPFGEFALGAPPSAKPTVFGVAGGTNPLGRVGFELDFQRINNMFRKGDSALNEEGEQFVGDNNLQSVTALVHVGHPISAGNGARFRPYGVFGGGLNIVNLGRERDTGDIFESIDFDVLETFSIAQQTAIFNCVEALPSPTRAALTNCGLPLLAATDELGDKAVDYRGVLTAGGGAVVKITSHIAARVDVRYFFKSIPQDERGPINFWRFTVGVVIHR